MQKYKKSSTSCNNKHKMHRAHYKAKPYTNTKIFSVDLILEKGGFAAEFCGGSFLVYVCVSQISFSGQCDLQAAC